jgi:hypothetical protein
MKTIIKSKISDRHLLYKVIGPPPEGTLPDVLYIETATWYPRCITAWRRNNGIWQVKIDPDQYEVLEISRYLGVSEIEVKAELLSMANKAWRRLLPRVKKLK